MDSGNWDVILYVNPSIKTHQTNNLTLFCDFKSTYKVEKDHQNDPMFDYGLELTEIFVDDKMEKIPHVHYVPKTIKMCLVRNNLSCKDLI